MKMIKKALELFLVSCLATVLATVLTAYALNSHQTKPHLILASLQQTPQAPLVAQPQGGQLPGTEAVRLSRQELDRFVSILLRIKQNYVEELDDKALFENAIQGVLSNLDPYSGLLDSADFEQFRVRAEGEFGGIGIDLSFHNKQFVISRVYPASPAATAGIQDGDTITHIEGQALDGQDLQFGVKLLRGQPGSNVVLALQREGEPLPLQIVAERELMTLQSVDLIQTHEAGYAVLRINQFQSHTAQDLQEVLNTVKSSLAGAVKGLVLDLRDNPGGLLRGAVQVSDLFLQDKSIVSTRGRIPAAFASHRSDNTDILDGAPIVVLVNEKSASSSEVVAAALQDNSRAIILGETTFGKGVVQTVSQVDQHSALKMTTAKYYTPQGRSIHGVGIVPDEIVEPTAKTGALESRAIELLKSMQPRA